MRGRMSDAAWTAQHDIPRYCQAQIHFVLVGFVLKPTMLLAGRATSCAPGAHSYRQLQNARRLASSRVKTQVEARLEATLRRHLAQFA